MARTFVQLVDDLAALLELGQQSGATERTQFKRFVNDAGRRLWSMFAWPERKKESTIVTAAEYTTGTVTVTNGSATVTGSGTTFAAAVAGRKFALSLSGPWYRISTRDSATQVTLARNYEEPTASAQTYTIFQDEYDLATDVDVSSAMTILYGTSNKVELKTQAEMDAVLVPGARGRPWCYCMVTPTTAGTRRIRFYPVPDAVYAFRSLYLRAWTDLSADADAHAFDDTRERLLLLGAALDGQRMADGKAITSEAEWMHLVDENWRMTREASPLVIQRVPFDQRRSSNITLDLSGLTS